MKIIKNVYLYTKEDPKITQFHWAPIATIIEDLVKRYKKSKDVLEIGPGTVPFPLTTISIGVNETIKDYISIDIDTTLFPFENDTFDFMYCRHVLEDIQNPDFALAEIFRTAKHGFIETPSPLIEISKGVDATSSNLQFNYCGYIHHRYIIWSYKNVVYILPKYPILEYLKENKQLFSIANNYPVYWNNYFLWDKTFPPEVVVYKNGVNMEIRRDYVTLLERAIYESMLNTNEFIEKIK